jgi:hypothetical protein
MSPLVLVVRPLCLLSFLRWVLGEALEQMWCLSIGSFSIPACTWAAWSMLDLAFYKHCN